MLEKRTTILEPFILQTLRECKKMLQEDGFVIDGIFGSFTSGELREDSDLDLLYHVEPTFLQKFGGFYAMKRIEEIKQFLEKKLHRKVDLAPSNNLSRTARRYIQESVVNVL
ncbi:nucleotidyltransferase domain-containing protein [Hydrogenimonas sp. SS33]|uniref:nucleotidyltransferase family protein n=1 Tax=Hydrogenimonas leucolamina TaxID=2954236 RepID=UPI00336BC083